MLIVFVKVPQIYLSKIAFLCLIESCFMVMPQNFYIILDFDVGRCGIFGRGSNLPQEPFS